MTTHNFVTGYGASDTHAETLSTGQPNPHPSAGKPYDLIGLQALCAMVADPPQTDKAEGQWIIPSSFNGSEARGHRTQKEHGVYHALAIDIDKGNQPLQAISEALAGSMGSWCLIWSTPSSTETNRKWRVLLPLASPLNGTQYSAYQAALFDALEAQGIICDRTMERPGQVLYLPNRGQWYQWQADGSELLDPIKHPIAKRAKQYLEIAAQQGKAATVAANEGGRSFLRAFRARHSIEELLELYGFLCSPSNPDLWRHPDQATQSYGSIRIMRYADSDRWVSLSETVNSLGVGKATAHGTRSGDAYDLYLHFNCAGNAAAAEAYARQCLQDEDAAKLGAASPAHGKEVWDQLCRSKFDGAAAIAEQVRTEELSIPQNEGNNNEWLLDWPPGAVGELAKWIYLSSSRPIKQYAIAASLYFFSAAGRKYNVDGSGLNLYMLLVGGTGRGKGVVKTAIDRVVTAIIEQAQDPQLAAPFSYEVAVSESGFRKALTKQNPICAYEEELGLTLLPLSSMKASANDIGLKKILTRLFDSGHGRSLGIKEASDQDRKRDQVYMPCMTLVGDTQPHVFRGLLGTTMVDSGFGPRMVPFFYYGKRKYHNKDSENYKVPPEKLVTGLRGLLEYCLRSGEVVVDIPWADGVKAKHDELDIELTDMINDEQPGAEMFNRAQAIVARVAGLLAVGINHLNPIITEECYDYARAVIFVGLKEAQNILATGGAGVGESVRVHRLRTAVKEFMAGMVNPDVKIRDYKTPKSVVDNPHIINDRYLIRRLGDQADFKSDAGTKTTESNVRETIEEAILQGILEEANLVELGIIADKRTKQKFYVAGPDF